MPPQNPTPPITPQPEPLATPPPADGMVIEPQQTSLQSAPSTPTVTPLPTTPEPQVQSQPALAPAPMATAVPSPTPASTASSSLPTGVSASQMGINTSKLGVGGKLGKKLLVGLVVLLVAAGIFGGLVFANVIPLLKFSTVTYNNGHGQSYKVKFYSRHTTKSVSQAFSSAASGSVSANLGSLEELVSNVSVDGKTPLIMWIESSNNTGSYKDCVARNMTKAFDVRINYVNASSPVCSFSEQGKDFIYITTFHDTSKTYIVFVSQDIDFSKLLSNSQNANDGLSKLDLSVYQDDLQTILGSIQPVK